MQFSGFERGEQGLEAEVETLQQVRKSEPVRGLPTHVALRGINGNSSPAAERDAFEHDRLNVNFLPLHPFLG